MLEARPRQRTMRLADALVGRVVGGRFRLGRLIDDARLCGTYEAVDIETRQCVAIEIIADRAGARSPAPAPLRRAARQLVGARHARLRAVQSVGVDGGVAFIVSAPVVGESLRSRLARTGPMSVSETLVVSLQIIDAISAAHAGGLIHGNLKPEKIRLTAGPNGVPVAIVMGLGVATVLGTIPGVDTRGIGTPPYLAPEQLTGFVAADEVSDVWGIGLLMFEMLTGQRAFEGTSADEIGRRIALSSPPNVCRLNPTVPVSLALIVRAVLARVRAERLGLRDLRRALIDVQAERKTPGPRVPAATGRSSARAVIFDLSDPCDDAEATTALHLIIETDLGSV